jgi:hypothetical protein
MEVHSMKLVLVRTRAQMEAAADWCVRDGDRCPGEALRLTYFGGDIGRQEIADALEAYEARGWPVWLFTLNPYVADYFPIGSVEQTEASIFSCSENGKPVPISRFNAIRIVEMYEANIMTLGNILESVGLW